MFDLPPIWFMARASVVCASRLIEPKDMAPVEKRLTISVAGITSSSGTGARPSSSASRILNRPRIVLAREASLSIWLENSLKVDHEPLRTACCSVATASGDHICASPRMR